MKLQHRKYMNTCAAFCTYTCIWICAIVLSDIEHKQKMYETKLHINQFLCDTKTSTLHITRGKLCLLESWTIRYNGGQWRFR